MWQEVAHMSTDVSHASSPCGVPQVAPAYFLVVL